MIGALLDRLRDVRRRKLWSPDQATGRQGEDLAHRYLRKQGFTIVARNYRLAAGDAEAWHRFEQENPGCFGSMYRFLLAKA